MPAVSADRPAGDEGSGQGQAPGHPYIDVTTGPIFAAGEPSRVDIALTAAEGMLRKVVPIIMPRLWPARPLTVTGRRTEKSRLDSMNDRVSGIIFDEPAL